MSTMTPEEIIEFYNFKTEKKKKKKNGLEKILRGLRIKTYICLLLLS